MDEKIVDLKIGDIICKIDVPDNLCTVVYIDDYAIATKNTNDGAVMHRGSRSIVPLLKEGDFFYYLELSHYMRDFKHHFIKIPDTKLARRLYKNMIHKEEGGKLWIRPSQSLK